MSNAAGQASRNLPQGCQVEEKYSPEEWEQFLQCARRGFDSGDGLDKEFYAKIEDHGVVYADARRAIRRSATLVAYSRDGSGRVAVWDGEGDGLLVIASEARGRAFNAFRVDDIERYMKGQADVRWLKR